MPTQPQYPAGTPEYDTYRAALTVELDRFATRQPPYDTDDLTAIGFTPVDWRQAGIGK